MQNPTHAPRAKRPASHPAAAPAAAPAPPAPARVQHNIARIAIGRPEAAPVVRRATDPLGSFDAGPEVEAGIQSARGGGQGLPSSVSGQMGQAFGADFSGVRVHADSHADGLSRSIQAKAFTTGNDIFFSQGAYSPASRGGQELLAHELTHVVQQGGAGTAQRKLGPGVPKNTPVVNHAPKEDEKGFTIFSATRIGYTIENTGTKVKIPKISPDDLAWGTETNAGPSRLEWQTEQGNKTVELATLLNNPGFDRSDFRYWFYYMLGQIAEGEKLGYLARAFGPAPKADHSVCPAMATDGAKLILLKEMFGKGFTSYEQLAQDKNLNLVKPGAEIANNIPGEVNFGYGFRGDNRPPSNIESMGGFTTKADSKDTVFKTKFGLDAPWNPFTKQEELPGQNPTGNAGYFRKVDTDNDLTTIISVTPNFVDASKFPFIEEYKENTTTNSVGKLVSQSYIYLILVESGFDTKTAQGANSFPEIATRTVPWDNFAAVYTIERTHNGKTANEGHVAKMTGHKMLPGVKNRYENSPSWPAILQTIEAYASVDHFNFDAANTPMNIKPTALKFAVNYYTKPGEDIFVGGGIPELGNWNLQQAKPLTYKGHTWDGTIPTNTIAAGTKFPFKYAVKKDGHLQWEGGKDHIYDTSVRLDESHPDVWHP